MALRIAPFILLFVVFIVVEGNDRSNAVGVMLVTCAVLTVHHQNIWDA